jgi:TPR repeat protein
MSGGVFICYRREESAFAARAIHDRIVQRLERENVFLDVDNIDLGVDWFNVLNERVGACDALVAVIGRNWVTSADKDNRRRIDDPDDFVRIEIEAALKRDVRVIPVLVDGAAMPKSGELPDSLKGLARRQGIEISPAGFDADVEKLEQALVSILAARRGRGVADAGAADALGEEGAAQGAAEGGGARHRDERQEAAEATRAAVERRQAASAMSSKGEPLDRAGQRSVLASSGKSWRVAAAVASVALAVGAVTLFAELNGRQRTTSAETPRAPIAKPDSRAPDGGKPVVRPLPSQATTGKGESTQQSADVEELSRDRLAADRGDANGQVDLGFLYEQGRDGLPKDEAVAARLYKLSADQGNALGEANLAAYYSQGRGGLRKDEDEAARLYKLSADQGNAIGQVNLGFFYERGRGGLPKDESEAARLYKLSADQGNALGEANLGAYYSQGRGGLPKDEGEAARLYKLSADQGNALGEANLAAYYSQGRGGLPKDEDEAAHLYKLAADQGNENAQRALKRLQPQLNSSPQSPNPPPVASQTEKSSASQSPFAGAREHALKLAEPSGYAEPGAPNMFCTQADFHQWDNCVGTHTYPNGNVYRGEFHNGMREGFGVIAINAKGVSDEKNIYSNEPSEYIGEFRGDRLNGHGVWFTASGAGSSGTFVNNIPQPDVTSRKCSGPSSAWTNCVAMLSYPNGNVYRGEFVQGMRQGVGLIEINATGAPDADSIRTPVPGTYVGEFNGGRLNGRGVIMLPDAGFYGLFTDNVFTPPRR